MGAFSHVTLKAKDPILGLSGAFKEELRPDKVNLGVGIYCEEDLKTPILKSVKEAEKALLAREMHKEYLPIGGDLVFCERMGELVFGEGLWEKERERIASFQALGGTGALEIGGKFLKRELSGEIVIPSPTWPNHLGIFQDAFLNVGSYPYYDQKLHRVDEDTLLLSLEKMKRGSVVLLHACCHNPTGADLTDQMWEEIAAMCLKRELIPFLDFAYQGFGRSLEKDAFALRLFLERGLSFLVAASCSKNFSLYGERVGALFIVTGEKKEALAVKSSVWQLIRTDYSNPPLHGAKIVAFVLSDKNLRSLWEEEVGGMRARMERMRESFSQRLSELIPERDFSFLKKTLGMFAFCGLSSQETEVLKVKYGIYMTEDGRVNVCGLNHENLDRVVRAIAAVLRI